MTITHEMNMHNCQLCKKECLGRCFGKHYGKDVSVDNEPCDSYEFGGTEQRLKEIERRKNMKMTVEFNLNSEQIEELTMLQKAMKKASNGDLDNYYTLEKVFSFAMELGSTNRINKAIENAAYHYDRYYDDYPYEYGCGRTVDILEEEKKVGHYLDTRYPNPRIVRD